MSEEQKPKRKSPAKKRAPKKNKPNALEVVTAIQGAITAAGAVYSMLKPHLQTMKRKAAAKRAAAKKKNPPLK